LPVEHPRIVLARERAHDLAHLPGREQRGEARVRVAGVVADDGQLLRAVLDQRVDQRERHAGDAEAADQHGVAVAHHGDGLGEGWA
jgi:hypothetical protein